MKASQLRKDRADTVRMSTVIKKKLTDMGWSIQRLFDWAVDEVIKIDVSVEGVREAPEVPEEPLDVPEEDLVPVE